MVMRDARIPATSSAPTDELCTETGNHIELHFRPSVAIDIKLHERQNSEDIQGSPQWFEWRRVSQNNIQTNRTEPPHDTAKTKQFMKEALVWRRTNNKSEYHRDCTIFKSHHIDHHVSVSEPQPSAGVNCLNVITQY